MIQAHPIQTDETESQPFWSHFSPCRHALHAFIKKTLNYSEDADDIYQDAVLRACRYFPSYNANYSFRAWVYSIAHNELKKHYRRRREELMQLPESILSEMAAKSIDPLHQEEVRRLHTLAWQLKPAWREVFFLFYQDGFSLDEVAQITRRSAGHVKFILHRCRKVVRAQLGV